MGSEMCIRDRLMAEAMASATRAGRLAYLAGRMGKKFTAEPSTSNEGKID